MHLTRKITYRHIGTAVNSPQTTSSESTGKSGSATHVAKQQKRVRRGWLQSAVDWLFGFDFFISYAHDDGTDYPTLLADELAQRKFRVFLDTRIYRIGEE